MKTVKQAAPTNAESRKKARTIIKEYDRISQHFAALDAQHRAIAEPLLQNAAFMSVMLIELQGNIAAAGTTELYQNGANQSGLKQTAELQAYNALIKNFTAVIKTLNGMLPRDKGAVPVADKLELFLHDL